MYSGLGLGLILGLEDVEPLTSSDFGSLTFLQKFLRPMSERADDKDRFETSIFVPNSLIGVCLVVLCTEVGQSSGDGNSIDSVNVRPLIVMHVVIELPFTTLLCL